SRTFPAWATITSCPSSLNNRLTHGECIPVSKAIRLRGMVPNTSRIAFGVVLSRCSNCTLPASSNTQYQLERSPRSKPTVNFCSGKFLICFAAVVLTFFIAGLLYLLCFKHVDNLGAYSIPSETGLLIPSGYINNRFFGGPSPNRIASNRPFSSLPVRALLPHGSIAGPG